ncbi:MAG: class I SAM-dependent methyltransferase [Pseudomonadota bacterium]
MTDRQLNAARGLARDLAEALDINASLKLWDGSLVALGQNVTSPLTIGISEPGVISSLLRRPTLDRVIRHYTHGQLSFEGGTIIDLGEALGNDSSRRRLKSMPKGRLVRALGPFVFAPATRPERSRDFDGDEEGRGRAGDDNRDFIQFHYDVGNEFYELFLDPRMQYSCAYFSEWTNSLEQAQTDKLEMVCRKLRLQAGEHLLDIGCGWGGLIAHAVSTHGVRATGITLSEEQLALAQQRVDALGIGDRVTLVLKDYRELEGVFDKIASVGMYEHIGLSNIPAYFSKVRSLLSPDGLFLNHAISRRAKRKRRRFSARAEQRALQKYIFPGGELDDIGHTIAAMEQEGFEVHDVEGWREHYAKTTRIWCERLHARKDEAIALVGEETWRIWVAYLGGCSLAFSRGSARIYQTLVSYSARGPSPVPPSRADLYHAGLEP